MSWFTKGADAARAAEAAAPFMAPDRSMKNGGSAVPGGQQFQFFPVQVGGPTPYARSRKPVFVAVCIYQLFMAIVCLVELANFLSGIIMVMGILTAMMAFKEDMNITYICWWGVLCFAGFIAGVVGALIGFAIFLSTIIVKFNVPLSCAFGMALAWLLYSDYEAEHHCTDTVGSWLRALGLLKAAPPPQQPASNPNLMSWGQLPQFGNSNLGAMKNQAGAYGATGQEKMQAYGATAQGGMQGYGGQMQAEEKKLEGFAAGLWGQAVQAAPGAGPQIQAPQAGGLWGAAAQAVPAGPQVQVPQGRHDTRRDPFMTM